MTKRATLALAVFAVAVVSLVALGLLARFVLGALAVPPLPAASSRDASPALPVEVAWTGGESRELRRLASEGKAAERGVHETLLPARWTEAHPAPPHAEGLRRPEIVPRDDPRIALATTYLAQDPHGHAAWIAAYRRSGRYRTTIDRVFRAWNVPQELAALAAAESGFSPSAVQADGSAGLWALTTDVAEAYGLTVVPDKYDERRAVEASTEVAGRYLADLKERFGSWPLAIFAFRNGYKRTADELLGLSSRTFEDTQDKLPNAEVAKVYEVFAVAVVLANTERFGLGAVQIDPAVVTSDIEVPSQAPLSLIARAAGTPLEHLRELNPEYLGDVVPTTGTAMNVHLPTDGLARAKELLTPLLYAPAGLDVQGAAHPEAGVKGGRSKGAAQSDQVSTRDGRVYYKVREGETLPGISKRFGVAIDVIASDNALDVGSALQAGQLLSIRSQP
jgi:hypothetical protein